jgi:hypothetical protein
VEIGPTEDRGASRSIETGNDGVFAFDGLAQGKYRLSASKRGYLSQAYEQHDNFSTAIAVGPGLQSEGLNFKVVPQAVITGVVTEEHGEPVRRAQVRLFKFTSWLASIPATTVSPSPASHGTRKR